MYEELAASPISAGGPPGLHSEVLDLWARQDELGGLRWYDPETGEDLRTPAESERKAAAEVRARQQAERERDEALRQVEDMAAELARRRGK